MRVCPSNQGWLMVALGRDCVCGEHHDCPLVHGVSGALLAPEPADYVGRWKH